jgi:tetratricopeptide (TPR) repeat protein
MSSRAAVIGFVLLVLSAVGAAAKGPESEPAVAIRFGVHPNFERAVFDWPLPIEYRLEQRGAAVTVSFDRTAKFDEAAFAAGLSHVAKLNAVRRDEGRLVVSVTLAPGIELRHFRTGTRVVLDFTRSATPAPAKSTAAPKPEKPPAPAHKTPSVTKAATALAAIAPAAAPAAPASPSQAAASAPTPQVAPAPATAVAPREIGVKVEPVRGADGRALRFSWPEIVPAAVFSRGGYLWIVFGRRAVLDLSALRSRRDETMGEFEVIEAEGAALRLNPPDGANAVATRDGTAWVIELLRKPRPPAVVATMSTRGEDDPVAARVYVDLEGAQSVIRLRDPEVGDTLTVVTSAASSAGVSEGRQFPQFEVLPSVQGLALRGATDGLVVRPLGNAVEIAAARGLFVSPLKAAPKAAQEKPKLKPPSLPRLFDLAGWRHGGPENFTEDRQQLLGTVAAAPEGGRTQPRVEMARFLFAYGQATEALAVLRVIAQEDPEAMSTAPLRAIRGVSALLVDDLEEAARQLGHNSLDNQPEAAYWRGALAVAQGNAKTAMQFFSRGADISSSYPPPFAVRLGLALAEARIAADDFDGAQAKLEAMAARAMTQGDQAAIAYLRGRLAAAQGDRPAATAIWEEIESGPNSPVRINAALARIDTLLAAGEMTPAQAIDALDRLRFAWRGDELEFAVLRRLGAIQLATGEYRAGLITLRQALTLFPDARDAKAVATEMAAAFEKLYVDGAADRLSPVQAIGLYEEFRELSPPGPRGDEIARRLADRLIAVDLLDRAADLLEDQIKFRLAGVTKAQAGARLAFVRLLDRNGDAALEALKLSEAPDLPAELVRDRRRLEARALADLGRGAAALERLAGDAATEADLLRADIHWKTQNWPGAAEALTRLAGAPPADKQPMPDDQARQVIHLAVALALAHDEPGLKALRERFGPSMGRGQHKDVFAVLTSERAGPLNDFSAIASRIATVAPFRSFLAGYRERLVGGGTPKS